MTYRRLTCRARLHLWCTAGYLVLGTIGLVASDNPANPVKGGDWVTWPNLMAIVSALISAGTVVQQWRDARAQIAELRQDMKTLVDETLPETYVRRDVFEARIAPLGSLSDHRRPAPRN